MTTQPIRVALAGGGAFGAKHVDGPEAHRRRRGGAPSVSSSLETEQAFAAEHGVGRAVATPRRDPRDGRRRRRHPGHARRRCTPSRPRPACGPASTCRSRSRSPTRWPTREAVRRPAAGDRAGRDGRPHAPLQPQPPVGAPPDRGRRASTSSRWTCRPTSSAAQNLNALGQPRVVDRPPAVAPRRAHGGPVRLPDRLADRAGQRDPGPDPPRARHRHGHVASSCGAETGAICTLSLSFNNDGPLGTFFRYIGDTGTYIARYDDLVHRQGRADRRQRGRRVDERHRAAGPRVRRRHPRGPRAQLLVAQVLPCYRILDELEQQLEAAGRSEDATHDVGSARSTSPPSASAA